MSKLEIVFPIYKDYKVFSRALEALSNQTFKDFTILVMDDTSPTGYEDIIAPYKDKLDIKIARNEKNLGAMGNMWQSIQHNTSAPYLLSHHADDYLKSDYLEKAIKILDENASISFVVTGPEWIHIDAPYTNKEIGFTECDTFDAPDFAKNILNFAPYMFGSVMYRAEHRVKDWKHNLYDGFCDRYFLGTILETHSTKGAYLHGNGIIERDHSLDKEDRRGENATDKNFIELLVFYKRLMLQKFSQHETSKAITNSALYYYSNFPARKSFLGFYQLQKKYGLIQISKIRSLGLYSLATTPLSNPQKIKLLHILKSIKAFFLRK